MYVNQVFELSMVLDSEKFLKVLTRASEKLGYLKRKDDEYIDQSMAQKGITVAYRDSQYKKKVRMIVNFNVALRNNSDVEQSIRKLDKRIAEYFGYKYRMKDFVLSGMVLTTDIDVRTHDNVRTYLKVLQRIGKVKGFSPSSYDCFEENESFCLDGNSNSIQFRIYDLGSLLEHRFRGTDADGKELKLAVRKARGVLRAEVQLAKPRAIRAYTDAADIVGQIEKVTKNCQYIFMDTFSHVIPFGDFYKKDKAIEIVRKEVGDAVLRRKMLWLLALIPEKKSLYLAQKAMDCRNIEKVMEAFVEINVSPVTISKRCNVKHLENVYSYILA